MKIPVLLSILLGWFLMNTPVQAQCLQYEVPLKDRVQSSSLIVEGIVIESQATWDNSESGIFTVHKVQVSQIFKGQVSNPIIEVATDGGMVGSMLQVVHPALELRPGQQGIFLLEPKPDVEPQFGSSLVYLPVAAEQGFVKYEGTGARDPFHVYTDRQKDLHSVLIELGGRDYKIPLNPGNPGNGDRSGNRRSVPPSISSFSPNPTTAGTLTELTINGNNFGTNSGAAKVEFKNADNGGAGYIVAPANHIQSWSNTQIKIWVPTGAGTGQIRVTNNGGEIGVSASNLTVSYNLVTLFASGTHHRPVLRNIDGNGGLLFQFNANFGDDPNATAAVERAFETWQCGIGVAFEVSPTTTDSACNQPDGINVVTWDTECPLPVGVLGRSSSFFSACFSPFTLYLVDTDIRFSPNPGGSGWNFGPGNPTGFQFDFESVALHEIGHSIQLAHIIAPGKVMHFQVSAGTTQRDLDPVSDIAGGLDVMGLSTSPASCGPSAMVAVNPPSCAAVPPMADFSAVPRSGCTPLEVFFTDNSTGGTPDTWEWDVDNDGVVDYTSPNPVHTYTQPGTYSVKLKVTNSAGSDSLTQTNLITILASPTADAGADFSACPGHPFTLGGNPTGSGGSGPLAYSWNPDPLLIGSSTVPNPMAAIQTTTTFFVGVTDTNECTAIDSVTVSAQAAPMADAGPLKEICEGSSTSVGGNPPASGGAGGYTYNWSPGALFDDSTAANPMVTPIVTVLATLTVTDQAGCTDEDTVTIRSLENPRADAGSDVDVCVGGGAVTIGGSPSASGGSGGYTYLWLPFTGLNNSGLANPVANPPTSQVYTLTVFDSEGCTGVDSMSFNIVPNPLADAGSDTTTCAGEAVQIGGNPTATGGTPGYGYNWNPAASLSDPHIANPLASPTVTTTYTVVVTDMNGCFAVDSVQVVVNPNPVADAGPDQSICGGTGPVTLEGNPTASGGTPGYGYQWSPVFGPGLGNDPSYEVNPNSTTTFTVEVVDANGCTDQDMVTVFVGAEVEATITGADTICPGECTQLLGQALSGSPPFAYNWSNGNTNNPITVCPLTTTTYSVTIMDGAGCVDDTSITVVVLPAPSPAISGLDTAYCENESAVTVNVTPSGGTLSGSGISGTDFDPAAAGVGVHTIYYEFTGGNGCTGTDSATVEVYAAPPKPTITLSNDTLFTAGGHASYKWIFNGVPIASATDTFFRVTVMGDYAVEVTNANGCTTKSDEIFVDPTGIDLLKGIADIQVYPNPAGETVWVRIEARQTMQPVIRLVSVSGALVWEEVQPLQKEHLVSIPVSQLAGGLYLLEIRSEAGSKWQRVIVE